MAMKQFHEDQDHQLRAVKVEPIETEPENSNFCYETVTKEEVILEDEVEHSDQTETVAETPTEISIDSRFKCSECDRTFKYLSYLKRCMSKHNAIRLELNKCKFCGKCFANKRDLIRHQGTHIKGTKQLQTVEDAPGSNKRKSLDDTPQKENSTERVIKVENNEEFNSEQSNKYNVGNSTVILQDDEGLFKCPECDRTHEARYMATKCLERHVADTDSLKAAEATISEQVQEVEVVQKEITSFCFETVTKEELIIDDQHAFLSEPENSESSSFNSETKKKENQADKPGPVNENPSGNVSIKCPFRCSECNKSYDQLAKFQRCERRCKVIKLERYKCKKCGKCCVSKSDLTRHESSHKTEIEHKNSLSSEEDELQGSEDIVSDKHFKCSECNRTFAARYLANKCEKKHLAMRLGLYECRFCKKRLATPSALKIHELAHKRKIEPTEDHPKLFACNICETRFIHKQGMEKHVRTQHSGELRFTCHKCNVKFESRPKLLSHIKKHDWDEKKYKYFAKLVKNDDGIYLCTICNKKFINQKPGIVHVFRHMNIIEGLFECKVCGLKCGDTSEYKIHIQIHKKPEEGPDAADKNLLKQGDATQKSTGLDCKTCRKRLRNKQSLVRHELIHRKRRKNQSSGDTAELGPTPEQDINKEGSKPDEKISSDTGEKEEVSRNSVEDHKPKEDEATIEQEDESHESLQEKSEPTETEGTTHLKDTALPKEHHFDQLLPTDQFRCDVCTKICLSRFRLKRHIRVHEKSIVPLECKQCDEIFYDKYNLYKHYESHKKGVVKSKYSDLLAEDEDNYKCLLCENTFNSRDKASTHVQRHMNIIEGIFQCKVCGLRCGVNSDYQLHIKTHKNTTDQRALPREIEGVHADYASSSNLTCEKSDLPLHCKTCNVFFNNKTNLNIHLWTSKLKIIRSKTAEGELSDGKDKQDEIKVRAQSITSRKRILKRLLPRDDSKIVPDENGFYNCSKCDYNTDKPERFRGHLRGHRAVEIGLYTCDVCQMPFPEKQKLFYHKKTHQKERIECLICSEKFETRAELYQHRVIHAKSGVLNQVLEKVTEDGKTQADRDGGHVTDRYICNICQKRCRRKKDLNEHMNSHEKLRFTCRICKEKFETKIILYRHKNTHNSNLKVFLGMDDDLYHCTRCEETFKTRKRALTHFTEHGPRKEDLHGEAEEDQDSKESITSDENKE